MPNGTAPIRAGLLGDDVADRRRLGKMALSTGREAATRAKKMSTKVHGARLGNVPDGERQWFQA